MWEPLDADDKNTEELIESWKKCSQIAAAMYQCSAAKGVKLADCRSSSDAAFRCFSELIFPTQFLALLRCEKNARSSQSKLSGTECQREATAMTSKFTDLLQRLQEPSIKCYEPNKAAQQCQQANADTMEACAVEWRAATDCNAAVMCPAEQHSFQRCLQQSRLQPLDPDVKPCERQELQLQSCLFNSARLAQALDEAQRGLS